MRMGQVTGGFRAALQHAYQQNNNRLLCWDDWPPRLDRLLNVPPVGRDEQERNGWNSGDLSPNMFITDDDPLTVHRHAIPASTDGARGKLGYTCGLHVWEISWTVGHRGTSAVVGVGTDAAPLHVVGFRPLVGSNSESWGWDIQQNRLYHKFKNKAVATYPKFANEAKAEYAVADRFLMILDMDEGTLSFVENGCFLGQAFDGLKGLRLYPMIGAVWGRSKITMKYIGGLEPGPLSLKELCRCVIRYQLLKCKTVDCIIDLPLPTVLKSYLDFKYSYC